MYIEISSCVKKYFDNFLAELEIYQSKIGLWLLAESHFAIHTFPEENKMYIEISSCVKKYFDNFLAELEIYQSKMNNEESIEGV